MIYSDCYWEDVGLASTRVPFIESLNHKRVLITGATGMICSSVVEILAYRNRKHQAGIRMILAGRNRDRIKNRFGDIAEYEYLFYDATEELELDTEVDYIIHGAGNAHPAAYAKEPVETLMGNIIGVRSLLELARKKRARFLYLSSSEVYGNQTSSEPFRESDYGVVDILNPRACYPNGKRAAETLCAAYGEEYGVDMAVVRPGHIYGPTITKEDTRASAQFTRSALNHENIIMKSAGEQRRSYCYTLDCASAILTVLLHGERGGAYNISNRNSIVSIREMAEALARYGGVNVVFENPSDAERKGYNMMPYSALNAEKLENLGWSAAFGLEAGVSRTIDMLRLQNEKRC